MKRKEAWAYRRSIEAAAALQSDEAALENIYLYPQWEADKAVQVGERNRYGEKLYKCAQAHTTQADWTPDVTSALWVVVSVEHEGTKDDPIPFTTPMEIFKDKYYTQDGVLYLCIRDSGIALTHNLKDLVGVYVEL
jgi:hypothetical protein